MSQHACCVLFCLGLSIWCCYTCNAQDVDTVGMTSDEIAKKKDWKGPLFVLSQGKEIRLPGALAIKILEPEGGNPSFVLAGVRLEKRGKQGFHAVKRILGELAPESVVIFHNYRHRLVSSHPLGGQGTEEPFDYKELADIVAAKRLVAILNFPPRGR